MENKNFTKITLEQSDVKLTWEVPFEDVTTQDMMQALRYIMAGMSFSENQVYSGMVDFLNEYASDKYDIFENVNTEEIIEDNNTYKPHYYD